MRSPTTLVLPVAGLGKRLQPLTFTTPKNLVLLRGKPILEYHLEEAARSGISHVVLVVSPKDEEKFHDYIESVKEKFSGIDFTFRIQEEQLGDGHAVLQAADAVGNDPCLMRFPDDIVVSEPTALTGLKKIFDTYQAPVLLLEEVPRDQVFRYGVVGAQQVSSEPDVYSINEIVEKPNVEEAPSNLIVIGCYALTPEIFTYLKGVERGEFPKQGEELRMVDAFRVHLAKGGKLFGWKFPGHRLDCGTLAGLEAAEKFMQER